VRERLKGNNPEVKDYKNRNTEVGKGKIAGSKNNKHFIEKGNEA